jgi:hypothetical protein
VRWWWQGDNTKQTRRTSTTTSNSPPEKKPPKVKKRNNKFFFLFFPVARAGGERKTKTDGPTRHPRAQQESSGLVPVKNKPAPETFTLVARVVLTCFYSTQTCGWVGDVATALTRAPPSHATVPSLLFEMGTTPPIFSPHHLIFFFPLTFSGTAAAPQFALLHF